MCMHIDPCIEWNMNYVKYLCMYMYIVLCVFLPSIFAYDTDSSEMSGSCVRLRWLVLAQGFWSSTRSQVNTFHNSANVTFKCAYRDVSSSVSSYPILSVCLNTAA